MDAMSDAIEGADVMLYGVSLAYKESANVWTTVSLYRLASEYLPYCLGQTARVAFLLNDVYMRWPDVQCRLECNYAYQQELDMIPLMMQQDYKPNGWRKSQQQALCCDFAVVMLLT